MSVKYFCDICGAEKFKLQRITIQPASSADVVVPDKYDRDLCGECADKILQAYELFVHGLKP